MSALKSVLGVSGVCWVGFRHPPQFWPFVFAGSRALCWVCWVWYRVRACVTLFRWRTTVRVFSYARTDKPNKPNTLNTKLLKILNLKGFICVGFVLSSEFFVSGSFFRGVGR